MEIKGSVAFVSGANRGIGEQYVKTLIEAGASKIYAAMRDVNLAPDWFKNHADQITPVTLDITKEAEVTAAAETCTDVNLLINNAGVNFNTPLIAVESLDNARNEIETNYFGTLNMCRAFASVLKNNAGGAIANVITILARVSLPASGSYCASKAAALSMTQCVRAELAGQGTLVVAVMPGAVDTRLTKDFEGPKMNPRDVALESLKAVENETEEIYPGEMATGVDQGLAQDPKGVEKEFAQYLPG
jgi:NAD(P)-dependent dehydrogenase (short-subunit alcohol dehydrogenase family)